MHYRLIIQSYLIASYDHEGINSGYNSGDSSLKGIPSPTRRLRDTYFTRNKQMRRNKLKVLLCVEVTNIYPD